MLSPDILKWRIEKGHGQPVYVAGRFKIEPRWQWKYLGGGQQGSTRHWWLLLDGEAFAPPFKKLAHAKNHAQRSILLRELGEAA